MEIIEKNIYKHDFLNITTSLLYEDVDYDTCITVLNYLVDLLD